MKLFLIILIIFLNFFFQVEAQVTSAKRFWHQDYSTQNKESFLLGLPNNDLIMFWYNSYNSEIRYARSIDQGQNWLSNSYVIVNNITPSYGIDINAIILSTGRVLVTYRTNSYYYLFSDNYCNTWSSPVQLPTRTNVLSRLRVFQSSLSINSSGDVAFVYSFSSTNSPDKSKGIFSISSSDGIAWSSVDTVDLGGNNGQIIRLSNSNEIIVFQDSTQNGQDIFSRRTTNSGLTWSEKNLLVGGELAQSNPLGVKTQNGKLWIYYRNEVSTPFSGILQSDINLITSLDNGLTWSQPQKFTKYVWDDINHKISLWNQRPIISFYSLRDYRGIYFSLADVSIDSSVPPYLYKFLHSNGVPYPNHPYFIQAFVDDDESIVSVKLIVVEYPSNTRDTLIMYDDGSHSDSLANDKIYGTNIIPQNFSQTINYSFLIQDNDLNLIQFNGSYFETPADPASSYLLEINNFKLPIDNKGILGDVNINGEEGGRFEESVILFSGGFFLSGLNNDSLWANGVVSASRIEDYQPGIVGSISSDPRNIIYIIKKSDPHFGESWQRFTQAAELGASFYDGNNDSIYNPIDINGNNLWDLNEDRPDFLGDVSTWCVYNDAVPSIARRWNTMKPMGIEVQQMVFAYGENVIHPVDNMIFIRYRIINKGTISNKLSDVYFSSWADPDIGGADASTDDLVGCDVGLKMGYTYNNGPDPSYGTNPPAFGIPLLQGPPIYISGETFIDINGNGIYDEGVDTPLDSAYFFNGPILGINILPGAKNLELTSFVHYLNGYPTLHDPNIPLEARHYMLGYDMDGNLVDPCTWPFGQVVGGVNCNTVNPKYLYSGNPISLLGWINNYESDQRMLVNTGPFTLEVNKPVDIIVSYDVGRGSNALASINNLKNTCLQSIQIYNSNFTSVPVGVLDQPMHKLNFVLLQNYPNPFNPSTKISWQSPIGSHQTLKVFDVLGNEIATLVNEYKPAGSYEVEFNPVSHIVAGSIKHPASGVYLYQLKVGSFMQTKKMLLLR